MRLSLLIALLLLPSAAAAGQTDWQELAPGVRMRMISEDVRRVDGTTMVGFELDMPAGTKTYWRVPGETGIPTQVDMSGSTGVSGETLLWPYPVIDQKDGYLDYVYYGPTVLPVAVRPDGDTAELKAAITLGVCSDICVPASAAFSLPLRLGKPDAAQQIRLDQAVALAPLPWTGDAGAIGTPVISTHGALAVPVANPDVDPASLIADVDMPGVLFGAPQKSPEGSVVTLPLLGGGDPAALEGRPVRLTFMTASGAYETTRTIGAASGGTSRQ